MEYGLIFQGTRTGKYYCKNMKYRIKTDIPLGRVEYLVLYGETRLHYPARLRARVQIQSVGY